MFRLRLIDNHGPLYSMVVHICISHKLIKIKSTAKHQTDLEYNNHMEESFTEIDMT